MVRVVSQERVFGKLASFKVGILMEPIAAASFFLDLAKSISDWYSGSRKENSEYSDKIANYLEKISESLTDYAESLSRNEDLGRGDSIKNRYYLEMNLSNLAWIIDEDGLEHPATSAVNRLKEIKVTDGMLVPEVSEMLEGGQEMPETKKKKLIEEMYRAAGEFKAASDIVRIRSS